MHSCMRTIFKLFKFWENVIYNVSICTFCHVFLNDNGLLDRDLSCNSKFIQFLLIRIISYKYILF